METKHYYSISEVSIKLGLSKSLIRFWEKQFDIKIKKNSVGYRLFTAKNVATLSIIKHLLKDKQYTIKGAKEYLINENRTDFGEDAQYIISKLVDVRDFLTELLDRQDSDYNSK